MLISFSLWRLTDYMMNGNFLFPGGSSTRNMSTSSSPMSTLGSNYRGAGGSFTTETHTTYISGAGEMAAQSRAVTTFSKTYQPPYLVSL